MGSKPKTPAPTAQDVEAERRARRELDTLTRDENERLKAIRRGRTGRRTLLGSGSELGINPGLGAGGIRPAGARGAGARGGGGGILSSSGGAGGGSAAGSGRSGAYVGTASRAPRASSLRTAQR